MTGACLPFDRVFPTPILDRGLSPDAELLRRVTADATSVVPSLTLEGMKNDARQRLEAARRAAAVPGWDGEGAPAADPLSYMYARLFIDQLRSDLQAPDIYVDPDGEFCLEWDSGPRSVFSVSIARDGALTYAGLFGASKAHGVETLLEEIPPAIGRYIERVAGHHLAHRMHP